MPNGQPELQGPQQLQSHRRQIIRAIEHVGTRHTARLAQLDPMAVSRFVNDTGHRDALTLFTIADALGFVIELHRRPGTPASAAPPSLIGSPTAPTAP
jgi:hypothetical protein